ncbi:hypothetical protein [Aureimonas sp. AU40]|uniref:hypothetical protein n=1 Tax=Aureimonas sp. AU40 TaxID=1637747 RepID=UPI0007829296|nr:hypothetical protein [Aureimonas sp. AU40]
MKPMLLRLKSGAFTGYNGHLGNAFFQDGTSVDVVAPAVANQIAGIMEAVHVDEDGVEHPAGRQHQVINGVAIRVAETAPLARQTDAEREAEERAERLRTAKADSVTLRTKDELDALADKGGIKAVRVVAEEWGLKGRSIPALIESILTAQAEFVEARNASGATQIEAPVDPVKPEGEGAEETSVDDDDLAAKIAAAAARGIADAINAETADTDETGTGGEGGTEATGEGQEGTQESEDASGEGESTDETEDAPTGSGEGEGTGEGQGESDEGRE